MSAQFDHIPVMLDEVLGFLAPQAGDVIADGTMGGGGYTRAILDAAKDCAVIAIDRDQLAHDHALTWEGKYDGRLTRVKGAFGDVAHHLATLGYDGIDGLVLDIGVSSPQLDQSARGFTFREDGPLDMRMDQSQGETAADLCNTMDEEDLANIIYAYGEERHSRKIARAIVKARPLSTTRQLAELVRASIPHSPKDPSHPATRTFQALRIAVNGELDELSRALDSAADVLKPGGRLVVVSFHSLEDRIVKDFLNKEAKPPSAGSRYLPVTQANTFVPRFKILTKSPAGPSEEETIRNPRARSARLRAGVRLDAAGQEVVAA
jgi:16S rRNA (cytosine1402-N4)-methyltransferase